MAVEANHRFIVNIQQQRRYSNRADYTAQHGPIVSGQARHWLIYQLLGTNYYFLFIEC